MTRKQRDPEHPENPSAKIILFVGRNHFGLSQPHWEAALQELTSPNPRRPVHTPWQPKWDFGQLPQSLSAEQWEPATFLQRGFPAREIPDRPVPTLKVAEWDKLVTALINKSAIPEGCLPHLDEVRSWLGFGCPEYLQAPGTTPTEVQHHISSEEVHMVSHQTFPLSE